MLFFGILSILLAVTSANFCYTDVEKACSQIPEQDGEIMQNCNAVYGSINNFTVDLQSYANGNIESSFEFLLLSSYFGNYENQREGFKKLYRKYSDKMWEDAVNIIKYITKRGGRMNFNQLPHYKKSAKDDLVIDLNELKSLAKALDTQKQLAHEAMRIHSQTQLHNDKHDAAIAHYIEEEFLEAQADRVRDLAGYTNDLKNLLNERDPSVSIFLFDEYLKKSL
ncbi:Soma ferritin [Eufriesea mexicana]|uniref:Ferritin n=2 Tax=Eufriesea mexicana TaxID=516756 RepID=A0A310SB21_9HYME|nr:PREDICTED: ferritin, lower subunit isoform X2 [Eufriesea mexicana]OAD56689.1 Soma ferritin [Eufriesea mexicana]